MEAVSTPRISAKHLDRYVNNTVIVVGKVLQLRGDTATIDADGNIQVNLNPDAHLSTGNGVQIIGKVLPDYSIKVMSSLDLGGNVDYSVCDAVVDVTHQHKDIFIYNN